MKAKVLANFRDKYTNELCEAGSVIEVSKDRYEEILDSGKFVEEIKKVRKEEETTEE